MARHAYSRCWLHVIWGTLRREKILPQSARRQISTYLSDYATSKEIYLKINYVNADHVHVLLDLPTKYSIEEVVKLLKGSSSHWMNQQQVIGGKFSWGRGYGAFSVSQSNVSHVADYIANQKEHHRKRTFQEEYEAFVKAYCLQWIDEENR